jgi:plasmid maintenance system antidote protein VapI
MNFQQLLREKGISRYHLSKTSGVPWATLSDIYSGKTPLNHCDADMLLKLSKALGVPLEELLQMDNLPSQISAYGRPQDKTYLELDLPFSIQKAIDDYLQGEKEKVLHLDCLSDELYGAINANLWGGCITEEQANYLRKKYLYADEESDTFEK